MGGVVPLQAFRKPYLLGAEFGNDAPQVGIPTFQFTNPFDVIARGQGIGRIARMLAVKMPAMKMLAMNRHLLRPISPAVHVAVPPVDAADWDSAGASNRGSRERKSHLPQLPNNQTVAKARNYAISR
jgi:hypothetical protein